MRIATMMPLAALVAMPLLAQEPPLDARLVYSGYGTPSFEINKAAYVALFEVNPSGVMQLYPSRTSQVYQLMGAGRTFFSPQDMAFIERMNHGFMFDPFNQSLFATNYSMYSMYSTGGGWSNRIATFGRRGLFLVVSTEPLAVGAPITSQIRLNRALFSQGHHFDLNRDSGLDALTALVASAGESAEVATDFVPILEQSGTFADGLFDGFDTYLTNCGRFGAIRVVDAWRYGALCSSGVIVRAVPPGAPGTPGTPGSPGTPSAPGPVGGGGCGERYGSEIVPCVGSGGGTAGTPGEGTRITDPERIRAFLAEMRDRTSSPAPVGVPSDDDVARGVTRGRSARGREASTPTVTDPVTVDNLPVRSRGGGTTLHTTPDRSPPRASAPRTDPPRTDGSVTRSPPPDRSAAPRPTSAPTPSPTPSPGPSPAASPAVHASSPSPASTPRSQAAASKP